jgi:hypothetical protein
MHGQWINYWCAHFDYLVCFTSIELYFNDRKDWNNKKRDRKRWVFYFIKLFRFVIDKKKEEEKDGLLMIIAVHIHWLVQTTSPRLTPMNNTREKKINFLLHIVQWRWYRMSNRSYVHILTYTENITLHRHSAYDLSPIIIFLFLPFLFVPVFFSLLILCLTTSNCSTLLTIAIQNSTYPVLVVPIASV